jgi:Zn ribbon nucleic-acid-binding protein
METAKSDVAMSTNESPFVGLTCPGCGEENTLRMDLETLDLLSCSSCENNMYVSEQVKQAQMWLRLSRWIEGAKAGGA